MSKQGKAFVLGIALIALSLLSTACPKKPKPKVVTETASTIPPVVTMTTESQPPAVNVTPPADFVREQPEPKVTTDELASRYGTRFEVPESLRTRAASKTAA